MAVLAAIAVGWATPGSAQPALPEREPPRLNLPPPPALAPPTAPADPSLPPGAVGVEADTVTGTPDVFTEATGDVRLRRDDLAVRADRIRLDRGPDRLRAEGGVEARRGGDRFAARRFDLALDTEVGELLDPTYFFALTGAGGRADRIDLLGRQRAVARGATYTSCPIDGSGDPDWLLSTRTVRLDFDANEGIAEGAVLRFLGVPILALPVLSFPLSSERKTGWLPPNVNLDTESGLDVAVPWYWNIAPHLDLTVAPRVMTRRGLGADTEFRYLDVRRRGAVTLDVVARDALTGTSRWAFGGAHAGRLPAEVEFHARWLRVSDDAYWKDLSRSITSITPRLLPTDAGLTRRLGDVTGYARVQAWQVLQTADPLTRIVAPYQRAPQLGVRWAPQDLRGWVVEAEGEFNRFTLPAGSVDPLRPDGDRLHAAGSVSHPLRAAGLQLVPRLSLNAAAYRVTRAPDGLGAPAVSDGRRLIPTLSLDAGSTFEREATLFGRATRQTLEPRLLYVRTPTRDQSRLPNFDAAPRDFNFESLFAENAFAGVDRVSDADQMTAGLATRVFAESDGGELLRLAVAQRLLFRDQRVTADGTPLTQRFSDVLVAGSTRLVPGWTLDGGLQYSPEVGSAVRTVVGARYSPGPFRTVSAAYRFTRGITEQVELGWQWPLAGAHRDALVRRGDDGRRCATTWYGVGRLNYSLRDSRVTDSLLGVEVDAGCWIGRIVAERLSTGRSDATTRLMLQLELVGLSRLGSNPLQALKDNVPGYQLLRSRDPVAPPAVPTP